MKTTSIDGSTLHGQVDQHGIGHRGRKAHEWMELLHRPLDDGLGGSGLETSVERRQLGVAELRGVQVGSGVEQGGHGISRVARPLTGRALAFADIGHVGPVSSKSM
jgi:hypothetical protein